MNRKYKGAEKKYGTIFLENSNIVELMKKHTSKQISEMYNISEGTVSRMFTKKLNFHKELEGSDFGQFTKDVYSTSSGAWKKSKEREALLNHNKYNNTQSSPVFYFKDDLSDLK